MARLFDDASSEYLQNANAVVSGVPCTFACWAYLDADVQSSLITVNDSGTTSNVLRLYYNNSDQKIRVQQYDGSQAEAITPLTMSLNVWHHCCGVLINDAERKIYFDGGNLHTETSAQNAMTGLDKTTIGMLPWTSNLQFWSGLIAEAAIWNIALTAAEAAILALGYSPLFVKPQNLVAYWPLVRGLNDKVGGFNMTATGTVVSAHPRVIYPSGIWVPHKAAAAPPGTILPQITNAYMEVSI